MTLVRPFRGLYPQPEHAEAVLAPPYDVLSSAEARALAADRPYSFLHVSKPEIDLPPDTDPYSDAVYAQGARNFEALLASGALVRDTTPALYVYRIRAADGHEQTGVALTASVAAYEDGRIKRHEHTLPAKETDRVRQIDAVNAQTGPVLLAHPASAAVSTVLDAVTAAPPAFSAPLGDGTTHSLWPVHEPARLEALCAGFNALPALYIADGHHRSAAAARVAAARGGPADAPHQWFLAVAFASDRLRILDYNRVVSDLNGLSPAELVRRLAELGEIREEAAPVRPARPGELGVYVGGRWHRLRLTPALRETGDPVARLDVSLLTAHILEPLLGIADLRADSRIAFVGGSRGLDGLQARVDDGDMAVAFALFPTPLESLMAIADAGAVMPPKSTWFDPKLADGVVSHCLD